MISKPVIIYIMGVSGCGKTTVGKMLSGKTGIPFFDADGLHPKTNIDKMKAGIPLTDEDRKGWLQTINFLAKDEMLKQGAIIACSALKESYRQLLETGLKNPVWIYLQGSYEMIMERMQKRKNHYMPPALLQSQFDILETPSSALNISIEKSPEEINSLILQHLNNKLN